MLLLVPVIAGACEVLFVFKRTAGLGTPTTKSSVGSVTLTAVPVVTAPVLLVVFGVTVHVDPCHSPPTSNIVLVVLKGPNVPP